MNRHDRTETALEDLLARYRTVIEAVVDGIVIIDERGRIETFNGAAERIFGYRREEVLGQNVCMLMPEPDASRHDGYIRRFVEGGEPHIIGIGRQVSGRRRNGDVFPMELGVGELHGSRPRRFIGTVRDVSARLTLESNLSAREQELRLLFDSAPIGVFSATKEGRFLRVKPAFCEMVGYDEASLRAMEVKSLLLPADAEAFDAAYESIRSGGGVECQCDVRWLRADGEAIHVSLHGVSVEAEDGMIIGQVLDRTAQVNTAQESREARERLAQVGRVTTLGEMASAIAHEINQPLTAISAYAQASRRLLERDAPDLPMLDETLSSINAQALRAGDVVRRIRGFVAHRGSGRSTGDLNEIVRAALEFSEFELRENQVSVRTDLASPLPQMTLDTVQLQQVCLNFIRNAVDAMADRPVTERFLVLRTRLTGTEVQLSCTDSGPGVSEDMRERLFEPFQTSKAEGMGMGLSISATIARAHGGEIHYEDAEGGGATFVIKLPITGN